MVCLIIENNTETPAYETANTSNVNTSKVNIPKVNGTALSRAVTVANFLIKNAHLSKIQASAVVGVYIDENDCNPSSYNKAEKNGKGASGTDGFGYGSGIASWTHVEFKNMALTQAGFKAFTPIESLSLEQQSKMVLGNINGNMKKYYNALKRCNTIEDASATSVIITGGVGYSKNWSTHPTPQEAIRMSEIYSNSNNKRFGKSAHHSNAYERRLGYAKQVLQKL